MAGDRSNEQHPTDEDGLKQLPLNSESLKSLFVGSADIIFRSILIRGRAALCVTLAYVDGLASPKIIDDNIVYPLTESERFETCGSLSEAYRHAQSGALHISNIIAITDTAQAIAALLSGKTLLCFDKLQNMLALDTIQFEKRGVESAQEESTFRTAKEGFNESLRVNTSMLRRKIQSTSLVLEETTAGRQSNTRICIAYMRNICNESFISQVRKSIGNINQDGVLSPQDIEMNVIRQKYTLFPQSIITEKPDTCVRYLLDGKIAVIIAEVPYAIVFPAVIGDFFKTGADYSQKYVLATMFRILRYTCLVLAVALPGFYISITTFHPEMIPYDLAIRIAASRIGVPFPVYLEALAMSIAFFTLLQASMMITQKIGSAISIVGGLVLGQAAISAGLVAPGVIVIIAATSISSLAVPNKELNMASWVFQLICTLLSAIFGLMGVAIGLLTMLYMLARLTPLGVPYLAPFAGVKKVQLNDSFVKFPENLNKERPKYLDPKNKRRMP